MLDSSRSAMTRNSSHLPSIYGKDFLKLVWENGQILAKGGSSSNNRTQNTPLYIGYSINEDVSTTKRARLNSSHQTNDQVFSQIDNSRVCTYSSQQQCLPSGTPFKKPRIDSSSQTQKTNSEKPYLGCDQRTGKVNFSNFSIPAVFIKSSTNYHKNSARINGSSARGVEEKIELKGAVASSSSKEPDHQSAVVESTKGSFQEQISLTAANKSNPAVSSLAEKSVEPHSSEALRENGKANNTNLCNEGASASVCSLEASNNPSFSIRKHEDTDDSAYLSDDEDDEEEEENMIKEKAACEGNRLKRSRNEEVHNLSERKRRDKINEKIRTLKELIPNCNKVDKASMLDDAIDYLKTLKLQLEIMAMGRGLCMPFMMLPHQLMGGGMGLMRPGTGIPPCSPTQFPIIPPMPAGVTDNSHHQMFGFSNQMQIPPSMPIPNAPFIPMISGNSSAHGNHLHSYATNLATHLANLGQLTNPDSRGLSRSPRIN